MATAHGAPTLLDGRAGDMGLELDDDIETSIFEEPGPDAQPHNQQPSGGTGGPRKGGRRAKAHITSPPTQPTTTTRLTLELENNRLADELRRARAELRDVRRELLEKSSASNIPDISALASLLAGGGMGKAATEAKIIELAKKALESSSASPTVNANKSPVPQPDTLLPTPDQTEIRSLKEKVTHLTRKLETERLTSHGLRAELGNARRALVAEVGDGVAIGGLGKEKLSTLSRTVSLPSITTSTSPPPSLHTASQPDFGSSDVDERQRGNLRKLAMERRGEVERLKGEVETLRSTNAEMKVRCEGALSRNQALDRSLRDLKAKLQLLVRKTDKDDTLIKALQNEVLRLQHRDRMVAAEAKVVELERQLRMLQKKGAGNANGGEGGKGVKGTGGGKGSGGRGTGGGDDEITSLVEKIEFLKDENDALKTTLNQTRTTHTSELSAYAALLDRTREMFCKDIENVARRVREVEG
ncbi:hypothetical protein HDV00_007340 [Rhizophlyctis rosea]|nr:hypothetical protein HDV00_007340 [Rhizophlyctis rosea]